MHTVDITDDALYRALMKLADQEKLSLRRYVNWELARHVVRMAEELDRVKGATRKDAVWPIGDDEHGF